MKIALASDHAGYKLKEFIKFNLENSGNNVVDFGSNSEASVDYPDYAVPASQAVVDGKVDFGILICGTGTGMTITTNKIKGIRAANCLTPEMAELARSHNNANVLTLGSRLVNEDIALEIVKKFLETEFEGGRHKNRIDKIHNLTGG